MTGGRSLDFRRDPLGYLERTFPAAGDAFWLPGRQLCIAEPAAARAVLANDDGLYQDHSDFFFTRRGSFGPRGAQVAIGRATRALLRPFLENRTEEIAAGVARLGSESLWPDAGNRLVYRHLATALIAPSSPEPLRTTVDRIVERAVLAGAPERYSWWSRFRFRRRVARELTGAVEIRRKRGSKPPEDLLDVVATASGPEAETADLAEVFLSFVFAIAGSVGFTLGWSIRLLGSHPEEAREPGWIVREALRLWPIAWFLARRPVRAHEVAGVAVTPADHVVACPYLVHRHPRHWPEPARFHPERWREAPDPQAWIPFGWGPHTCAAASLSLQLVEAFLRVFLEGYDLNVHSLEEQPFVGPALAPPRFSLRLGPRRLSIPPKGGDRDGEVRSGRDDGPVDSA